MEEGKVLVWKDLEIACWILFCASPTLSSPLLKIGRKERKYPTALLRKEDKDLAVKETLPLEKEVGMLGPRSKCLGFLFRFEHIFRHNGAYGDDRAGLQFDIRAKEGEERGKWCVVEC